MCDKLYPHFVRDLFICFLFVSLFFLFTYLYIYSCRIFYPVETTPSKKDDSQVIKRVEVSLKRKQNEKDKEKNHKRKKCRKRSEVELKPDKTNSCTATSELSDSDKKLLEKWENMQNNTKPFVHPIRKYMADIRALKKGENETKTTIKATDKNSEVATSSGSTQCYQFHTYLSQKGDGESLKALKNSTQGDRDKGAEAIFAASLLGKFLWLVQPYVIQSMTKKCF